MTGKLLGLFKLTGTMKAKVFVLNAIFKGLPKLSDYRIIEETLPAVKQGEFLAEAMYITVDPYMRLLATTSDVGKPIQGAQVAKIIESKNEKFPVGKYVVGEFGWRTHTVAKDEPGSFTRAPPAILPDLGNLPKSLALGVLGAVGNSAYFGFLDICKPKEGDTVVVSAAGGAVGTVVGQIAKIKGCRVVGITGSDDKGQKLMDDLGFDAYVNYKKEDFEQKLSEATPKRIDCYFDNVGGEVSSIILNQMNKFGRVSVCGSISTYNSDGEPQKASEVQTPIKIHHVRMEGFQVFRFVDRWNEGSAQIAKWITEGKLKYKETITEGFENTSKAFVELFEGKNFGKSIVKVI